MKFDVNTYFTVLAFVFPFAILVIDWFVQYTGFKSRKLKREEYNESFHKVIDNLSSNNPSAQLSAAVLLRRFFSVKVGGKKFLLTETINVISSILRTVPISIYQKTLADGLAYAGDLTNADLQRTNLQNARIESKTERVIFDEADLFMANLSYALIKNVQAHKIILYNAFLNSTVIKNSDFTNANFVGADLTNIKFTEVDLFGADFSNAKNIPPEISANLKDGIYIGKLPVSTTNRVDDNIVFFSMPGNMSKNDELIVLAYKEYLLNNGFEVLYYNRDTYPRFGQLSLIKSAIERSSAVIVFGFKQLYIKEGTYRPEMDGEIIVNESWRPTPWNEVELGMASMKGLPILLVKDEQITEGIFDDIISESFMFTISSKVDIKELENNEVFNEWKSRIND